MTEMMDTDMGTYALSEAGNKSFNKSIKHKDSHRNKISLSLSLANIPLNRLPDRAKPSCCEASKHPMIPQYAVHKACWKRHV